MEKVKKFIIPFIIGIVYITIIILNNGIVYGINDDIAMRAIASGSYTDNPTPHMFFSGFPYSVVLTLLYKFIPQIDWYGTVLLGLIFSFMFFVLYYALENVNDRYKKIIYTMLMLCFFSMTLPALFVNLTFTKVAGYLVSCSLILYLLEKDSIFKKIVILIGIVFAFAIRRKACLMILVFFGPAYLYKNWNNKEKLIKDFIFGSIVALTLASCFFVEKVIIYHYDGWDDYYDYNKYRLAYYDYYSNELAKLEPEEKAKYYEQAGIEKNEVAYISNYHITLSDSLPTKLITLVKLCEENNLKPKAKYLESAKELFLNSYGYIYIEILIVWIVTFCFAKNKKELLYRTLPFMLLEIGILVGIIYNSRIVERVYSTLFFGFNAINIILIINELKKYGKIQEFLKDKQKMIVIPICVFVSLAFLYVITREYFTEEYKAELNAKEEVLAYIDDHPDNFYLFNRSNEENYVFVNKYKMKNSLSIGGWTVYSPVYYIKLESKNAKSATELLLRDNVYIILPDQVSLEYYEQIVDDMQMKEIDRFSGYVVFKAQLK